MKIYLLIIYIIMGLIFIFTSTVFYPKVTTLLMDLQEQMRWETPPFWDLSLVLKFVRVIFLVVGVFLTGFGIALFWMKR